jgi:MFS transporter, DHA2 family, multidrug resistance protein
MVAAGHAPHQKGGSVGTSLSQALQDHREQLHTLRLGEYLDPFNSAVQSFLEQSKAFLRQQTGDPVLSQELAWQALESLRQQQASATCLFRLLLGVCHVDACTRAYHLFDEALSS